MKKVKILDDSQNEIEVDIKSFYQHLKKYHSIGESLHEEQGHYFTVDEKFRKKIKQLLDSNS
ncbi:MAG: hypothetical protein CMJ02_04495 [Pelagibacteraceae bacterium]|jgi:hypothetical protein|nr:hypothetical protein [Pelagibacteraceae bacterium]OUV88474.1 MAG: hypothetical protein CBD06_04160 [Pelagibacteraceae bacterium TMED146]RZO93093.1 MAG: hypothetical protein EVA56_00945 [alpha proteobacterium HIMB114]|tara:strand:- start:6758 stop:6943 length:186 start_codon:yes stop_codon:yes gene_type:complete